MHRKATRPGTLLLWRTRAWEAIHWRTSDGNGSVVFFQLNLPFMWNLKKVYPCQGKGVKLQLRLTLVMRKEGLYFSSSIASLVANNSICDHGSHLRIENVFKCVRALRHPHLRKQFKQDKWNWNMSVSDQRWGLSWDTAHHGQVPPPGKGGLCRAARFHAAWRCIWAL